MGPAAPSPLPPSGGAGLGLDRVGAPCDCHCLLWGFHNMHPVLLCRGNSLPKTPQFRSDRMRIQTILNRIEKQPGCIYDTCRWRDSGPPALVTTLRPQAGGRLPRPEKECKNVKLTLSRAAMRRAPAAKSPAPFFVPFACFSP